MIESWMISVVTGISAIVASYTVIKYKVENSVKVLEDIKMDTKEHMREEELKHDEMSARINAGFKKLDEVSNSVIVLQRDTSYHLDMKQAETKFVSKEELDLHLRNIDNELSHLNKNGDLMVGKLEDLTKVLSQFMIKNLNKGNE